MGARTEGVDMTDQGATSAVLISTIVTIGSTTGYSLTSEKKLPANKTLVGGFFAMMGCAVLAEIDPNIGGPLAIAIALTAFSLYGIPTLNHYFTNPSK
jgi:hypothetical protein